MSSYPHKKTIVIGGGLAGFSAVNTVLENGGSVLMLDKSAFCGGNSTKATSGINGCCTSTQASQGIQDSVEIFSGDCLRGGAKQPELVKVLCEESGPSIEWLIEKFSLDLSLIARLGGHSQPRTHRGKERFPGMTITYALIQMAEKIAEANPDRCQIINKAKATKLLTDATGQVVGVEYEKGGKKFTENGAVVLATGGFGADFTQNSLLAKYRPDLMHLPTTNGEHCTGDGIKMGVDVGAGTVDLEWVQVHPTGLVNPDDPDAKVKFLAAEALRGVGGVLLDADGNRFANELGRRDYVTGQMWKNKGPFRLILNSKASTEIHWHCEHYKGRGVMKYFASGAALAAEMGVPASKIEQTFKDYNEVAEKMAQDPEGGPYDAYPTGKSWDKWGKKFYHNYPVDINDEFHVAIVTPVIHYCMGGLQINTYGQVMGTNGKPITGLYAAGEIMGGVHGNNRLGGNSLLDCVVYGRVTGRHCSNLTLGSSIRPTSLSALCSPMEEGATDPVIVIGGGLAGFSAVNTVLENGGNVVLLDKSAFCGGNSTKATSGINGCCTSTQRSQGINDTVEIFSADCLRGGAKKPDLVKVLCSESGSSVEWLIEKFNLDLSLIARLGGHSQPRTHRGKERFPGMTITYALIQMAEKIAEANPNKCKIINKARATRLLTDSSGKCVGVEYEKNGQKIQLSGPVVLATGGFGADFTQNSILAKYRPDLMHLPTTNGEHCTGDGIKMGEAVGAGTIDLEWVQVHPTGLVNPDDPDAKVKFLAAEALRGVGGVLLDADGNRFANELGRRDYVTGQMWKNKGPFRLILNSKASTEIHWHCEHYKGRGVMKYFASGAALAAEMGVPASKIEQTFKDYNEVAEKMAQDPEGGPYDAYPTGKSWDKWGKKFYHNYPVDINDEFHVAIVTPVIHYCMGGLEIDNDGRVLNKSGRPIDGLYAAGEIMGGVHGNNRLGGNSLLDCVVFGRVTGRHCAAYHLGDKRRDVSLAALSTKSGSKAVSAATPAAPAAAKQPGLTLAEVAKHNTKNDCWVVVNDQVLDVTSFLPDHPGGELAILTFAGKDASAEFNMIHPPDVIGKYAPDAVLGNLGGGGEAAGSAPPSGGGYTMAEVAKHSTKNDCWVVLHGEVLDVTSFLPDHPGGELAILTFGGKDATAEFDMIHPPDVVRKYAPDAIIGKVATGGSTAVPAAAGGIKAPLLASAGSNKTADDHWWGPARNTSAEHGPLGPSVWSFCGTIYHLIVLFVVEIVSTIFCVKNWSVPHDKSGLTRSAMFLIVFVLIHGIGNLHVFAGPDAFNGYAYFLNRPVPWGTLLLPVELYLLAAGIMHAAVGALRTYKFKKFAMLFSESERSQVTMAVTGAVLFVFLLIHLFQFRIVSTFPEYTFRVKWMYPFYCVKEETDCDIASFKDLYKMEFVLFESFSWVVFYIVCVFFFVNHMSNGWDKVMNSSAYIPKAHKGKARFLGLVLSIFIGLCYASYPLFCYFFPVKSWKEYDAEHITYWEELAHPH